MKIVCQGCMNEIDLPEPTMPRIINLPAVSMILLEHPAVYHCPDCNVLITHGICGGDALSLIAIPLPEQEKPPEV